MLACIGFSQKNGHVLRVDKTGICGIIGETPLSKGENMYLQITNRCNMTCEHCCSSCTMEGEDMKLSTFRTALDMCEQYGESPFIGGGEPTLHALFEQLLCEAIAMAAETEMHVGIVTNGSMNRRAFLVCKLAKAGVITAELSRDVYHDEIDMQVVRAFEDLGENHVGWKAGIRDTTRNGMTEPLPHGRAKELLGWDDENEDTRTESDCPCESWMVLPSGEIKQCGCDDSPTIGHVDSGLEIELLCSCCRSQEFKELAIEEGLDHLLR